MTLHNIKIQHIFDPLTCYRKLGYNLPLVLSVSIYLGEGVEERKVREVELDVSCKPLNDFVGYFFCLKFALLFKNRV